jgi:hypothetical protein
MGDGTPREGQTDRICRIRCIKVNPDFLFHIPGTSGMFTYDELDRRTRIPKRNPDGSRNEDYLPLPRIVELKEAKRGHPMGVMAWGMVVEKFG